MCIYHTLTDAWRAHVIYINLNTVFCIHVEQSCQNNLHKVLYGKTKTQWIQTFMTLICGCKHVWDCARTHARMHAHCWNVKGKQCFVCDSIIYWRFSSVCSRSFPCSLRTAERSFEHHSLEEVCGVWCACVCVCVCARARTRVYVRSPFLKRSLHVSM